MAISAKTGSIINSDIDRFVTRETSFLNLLRVNNCYVADPYGEGIGISIDGINWVSHILKLDPSMSDNDTNNDNAFCIYTSYNNDLYLYANYNRRTKVGLFKVNISNTGHPSVLELFSTPSPKLDPFAGLPMFKIFNDILYFANGGMGIFKITSDTATRIVSGDVYTCGKDEFGMPYDKAALDFFIVGSNAIIIKSISDGYIDQNNSNTSNESYKVPCFISISTVTPNGSVSIIDWSVLLGAEYTNYFDPYNHTMLRAPFNFGILMPYTRNFDLSGDISNIHGNTIAFASHAKEIGNDSYTTAKSVFIFSNDSGVTWRTVLMSSFSDTAGISSEDYFTSSVSFIYDDTYVEFSNRNGNRGLATAHRVYPGNFNLDNNQWTRGIPCYPLTLWKSYDGFFYGLDAYLKFYRYEKSGINQAVPHQIDIDSFKYRPGLDSSILTNDPPVVYLQDNLVFILDDDNNLWYSTNNANFYKINHKFDAQDITKLKGFLCAGPMVLVHKSGHIVLR